MSARKNRVKLQNAAFLLVNIEIWFDFPVYALSWQEKDIVKVKLHICMYRKITSSNTSRLEAHVGFFRLLKKGIFGPYVL